MARANQQQFGLRYWGTMQGGQGAHITPFSKQVASAYATALYPGDPVIAVSDGTVAQGTAGGGVGVFGVISHIVQYRNSEGALVRNTSGPLPASTTYTADTERSLVAVIPVHGGVLFEVDADEGSSITTIANARLTVGENADHIYTSATADSGLGLSSCLLDISTHAVTATLQWRIWDVLEQPGNDPTVTHGRYLVYANILQNIGGLPVLLGV